MVGWFSAIKKGDANMSTRQYIGARYVPKFFDWGGSAEWRSGVAYEALTIVTRNGNSYTSKIPVPSNVGAPESNPDYWVATGLYNEQVDSIRQLAEQTANTLSGFMANGAIGTNNLANDAVTGDKIDDGAVGTGQLASGSVTSEKIYNSAVGTTQLADNGVTAGKIADGAVTTEKIPDHAITADKLAPRYIINVGDSYQEGYDPQGNNDGWGAYLLSMFGYRGHNIQGVSGAGFGAGVGSQFDLAGILEANPPTDIDYDKVTDIVVGSGYNDFNRTVENISDGISRFYTHCKTRYPNARIWLAPIGWAWTNTGHTITPTKVGTTFQTYHAGTKSRDIFYVNSCLGLLLGCNGMSSDHIHPNERGNKAIAAAIHAAFEGQEYIGFGGFYQLAITSAGWSGTIAAAITTCAGIATIRLATAGLQYSGDSVQLTEFPITFAAHPLMFVFSAIIAPMVQYDNHYANTPVSFAVKADATCGLGFQVINETRNNYVSAESFRTLGTLYYQPAFAVSCANEP